jgi:putative transposase
LVFVTKYRHQVFTARHLERLEEIMRDVCADFENRAGRVQRREQPRPPAGQLPAQGRPVPLVNSLKGVSSRRMRQEFPDLARHYWRANRLWSGSYFAGSVGGAPISVLRQYIEQQNRPA